MPLSDTSQRARLERAGSIHWFHWVIVGLSACVTCGAWYFAQENVEQKRRGQFEREADRVRQLVVERMEKYEDALWSGVAVVDVLDGDVSYGAWREFAESLRIDEKYPGIRGIGVIDALEPGEIPAYLEKRRLERPDFRIYPYRISSDYFPITFIEPVAGNEGAVGLDIAHEANRYTAALRAGETGRAQITGPITLVQDEQKTPGFLFYAPFYVAAGTQETKGGPPKFAGMVYAPFVFANLLDGILAQETRHVSLSISDGSETLYDEHLPTAADHDPDPLYSRRNTLAMYGHDWTFDIRSSRSFRQAHQTHQPTLILIGGILIDGLLVGLFVVISATSRKALGLADAATVELNTKAAALEESNQELERFVYVASHDLQEPLRMVSSFASLLKAEYEGQFDEQGERWLGFMIGGAKRMQSLVQGLLAFSRIEAVKTTAEPIETNQVVATVLRDLEPEIADTGATVELSSLPAVHGREQQLHHVFKNLLSNAIKFRLPGESPSVRISATSDGTMCTFAVSDDGIGIDEQYADRVFVIFQRLHTGDVYEGAGVGLAIAKKVVTLHGGTLWFESNPEDGSTFCFTVPLARSTPNPPPINSRPKALGVHV